MAFYRNIIFLSLLISYVEFIPKPDEHLVKVMMNEKHFFFILKDV